MKFEKIVLPNGLRVITVPMPSFESATALVMVGAGSRYETKKNNGISHFLEHMAFKGTENRPSAMDISSLIDGIGGEFNAFTGKEYTGYYVKAAKSNVETILDVLSDMLQRSLLDRKEIEKEKGVIIEEINLYEDMPMRKIGDIYEKLLYGDTPMGWDIAGEKDIIRSITREDFVEYMSTFYSPDNMTVVVAGGVETENMREGATDRISYGMDENGQHLLFVDTTTSNLDTTRRSPTAEEVVRFAEVAAESLPDSPYTTNLIGHAQARINELQARLDMLHQPSE